MDINGYQWPVSIANRRIPGGSTSIFLGVFQCVFTFSHGFPMFFLFSYKFSTVFDPSQGRLRRRMRIESFQKTEALQVLQGLMGLLRELLDILGPTTDDNQHMITRLSSDYHRLSSTSMIVTQPQGGVPGL